jgi:predicted MPP superfamily phosphohydrolase
MSFRNILHISDLHCTKSSGGSQQNPSEGGYVWDRTLAEACARNIREAFKSYNVPNGGAADLIVVTGDFVHQGSESFDAAETFLKCFADVFAHNGVSPDVILCPGNHDYNREMESKGLDRVARGHYETFEFKWHEKILCRQELRRKAEDFTKALTDKMPNFRGAKLITPTDRFFGPILTIDATWCDLGNSTNAASLGESLHKPKAWTTDAGLRNLLFESIATHIGNLKDSYPTLVLTHYPVDLSTMIRDLRRDVKTDEHISSDFKNLIEVLLNRTSKPVIIFSGDVHEPDEFELQFVNKPKAWAKQFVSGRCYLQYGSSPPVPWRACARMVIVKNGGFIESDIRSVLIKYGNDQQNDFNPSNNLWSLHSSSSPIDQSWHRIDDDQVAASTENAIKANQGSSPANQPETEVISEEEDVYENELERFILQYRPVELIRVKSYGNSKLNRLIQIRIGPIMNHTEAREYAVNRLVTQLGNWINEKPNPLLIGLDCWGHCLASRIGFELVIESIGLSVRGLTDAEFDIELQRRGLTSRSRSADNVRSYCFITDIIATGETIMRVKNAISGNPESQHVCLSLVRSKFSHNQNMLDMDSFSVLDHFPIPILSDEDLPDEKILVAKEFGLR